jgi:hypothetical protein
MDKTIQESDHEKLVNELIKENYDNVQDYIDNGATILYHWPGQTLTKLSEYSIKWIYEHDTMFNSSQNTFMLKHRYTKIINKDYSELEKLF